MIVRCNILQTKSILQINLWLLIAIIILASVLSVVFYYCIASLKTKYFWWKQILVGAAKIILPLVVVYAGVNWLADNVEILKEFILVTIVCESVAIVVNPFPKWCFDNNIDGLAEISDKIFHRKDNEEETE